MGTLAFGQRLSNYRPRAVRDAITALDGELARRGLLGGFWLWSRR
jgi:hypothetical protein